MGSNKYGRIVYFIIILIAGTNCQQQLILWVELTLFMTCVILLFSALLLLVEVFLNKY